ncbi:MAG: hypothetical protein M1825_005432 [Sarcosagium campestre]|nr:MAG: hypothetical protein M1825_005432 [Sarcosagium campestre]
MQVRRSLDSQRLSRPHPPRFASICGGVRQTLPRSSVERSSSSASNEQKPPQLEIQSLPDSRLDIPHLHSRNNTPSPTPASPDISQEDGLREGAPRSSMIDDFELPSALPSADDGRMPRTPPPIAYSPAATDRQYFIGVGPEEQRLADLVRHKSRRRRRTKQAAEHRGCFPYAKRRDVKRKLICCLVSGIFLSVFLTTYLGLALSSRVVGQEIHIVLILIILGTTIFFCHSLVRLCMLALRPAADRRRNHMPARVGPNGFAQPDEPIQVVTALDEEAIGEQSEATKQPPPAYGLWRCSVRVDPNLIHWQRVQRHSMPEERAATPNRPPSYMSDDGVEYAVSAATRPPPITSAAGRDVPHAI